MKPAQTRSSRCRSYSCAIEQGQFRPRPGCLYCSNCLRFTESTCNTDVYCQVLYPFLPVKLSLFALLFSLTGKCKASCIGYMCTSIQAVYCLCVRTDEHHHTHQIAGARALGRNHTPTTRGHCPGMLAATPESGRSRMAADAVPPTNDQSTTPATAARACRRSTDICARCPVQVCARAHTHGAPVRRKKPSAPLLDERRFGRCCPPAPAAAVLRARAEAAIAAGGRRPSTAAPTPARAPNPTARPRRWSAKRQRSHSPPPLLQRQPARLPFPCSRSPRAPVERRGPSHQSLERFCSLPTRALTAAAAEAFLLAAHKCCGELEGGTASFASRGTTAASHQLQAACFPRQAAPVSYAQCATRTGKSTSAPLL